MHSSTRVDIERAIGLRKGKVWKLKLLHMRNVEDIPSPVITCCALHNFLLMREILDESEVVVNDENESAMLE